MTVSDLQMVGMAQVMVVVTNSDGSGSCNEVARHSICADDGMGLGCGRMKSICDQLFG